VIVVEDQAGISGCGTELAREKKIASQRADARVNEFPPAYG
jgi:hypothetical protein